MQSITKQNIDDDFADFKIIPPSERQRKQKVEAADIDGSRLTARAPQTTFDVHKSMLTYTKPRFVFFLT